MSLSRTPTGVLAALLLALAAAFPVAAQNTAPETTAPTTTAPEATATEETPTEETPTEETAPEATATEDTAPEAPADDAAAAPSEPAAAEEAPAEPEIVTEVFGDWEKRCTADQSRCFMYQLARDESGNPVAEITIVALPDGEQAAAGATIVTPLGTLLTEGLVIQVDSGQARKYDFGWCTRSGCFARFGMEADYVNNLKRGNRAVMQLSSVSAPERPIGLSVSLAGFTAAFDALKAAQ
ncbi:MAG: invasion associated locus B family protein [Pseudomonadota bacterium]